MYASRDRRRGEARILYWFRTPPNVRVGRAALDEEAIRSVEEHNPGLTFDWTRILKARPPDAAPVEESARDRRRRERAERGARARPVDRPSPPPPQASRRQPPAEAPREPAVVIAVEAMPDESPAGAPEMDIGSDDESAEAERPMLPPGLHVEERLGPEGFSRLRARYAELMARISERVQDPVRLEELRTQAERLNPDTWITDEEARAGIEGFDAAYEAIRTRLGRRRRNQGHRRGVARRRRRRGRRRRAGVSRRRPPDRADVL